MNDLDDIAALLRNAPKAEPAPGSAEAVISAVRDELAEERRIVASLRGSREAEPSATLCRRVMGAVMAERARERRMSLACRVVAAAASVAAIVAVATVTFDRNSADTCAARDVVLGQIVDQQDMDGAWTPSRTGGDDSFKPALTAVSAIALMKRDFGGCGAEVDKAVGALLNMQNPDGSFGTASSIYNHAFASYAILEYKRRGGKIDVSDAVSKAVGYAVSMQNHDGSWGYSGNARGDSALTIWEAGVLVNAQAAGWGDDDGNLRRALSWIRKGGCDFDYRQAIDRENSPDDGAIALTALATAAIEDAAKAFPAMGDVLDQSRLALRGAYSRSGMKAAGGLCRTAMSIVAAD